MLDKTLQEADLKPLFQKEAVFIGNKDVIPVERACRLLGKKATEHAKRMGRGGEYHNMYGVDAGSYQQEYLTYNGFKEAVSYYNISILRELNEE